MIYAAAAALLAGIAWALPVRIATAEGTLVVTKLTSPTSPQEKWGVWLEEDDGGQLLIEAFPGKLKAAMFALEY